MRVDLWTFKRERQKIQMHLNTTKPIMTIVPRHRNMADGGRIEFRNILIIISVLDEDVCTKFGTVRRCNTTRWKCSRD